MVIDEVNEVKYPRYLVYDIVTYKGIEVGKTDFSRRLLCIHKEIVGARKTYIEQVNSPFTGVSMVKEQLSKNPEILIIHSIFRGK